MRVVEMIGAPKRIAEKDWGSSISAPQHDIDYRIALLAFANLDRVQKHMAASKLMEGAKWRAVCTTRRMAVDVNRRLAKNNLATLTHRQREVLEAWLTEADREHINRAVVNSVPECLRPENLPKRPPIRRQDNENG